MRAGRTPWRIAAAVSIWALQLGTAAASAAPAAAELGGISSQVSARGLLRSRRRQGPHTATAAAAPAAGRTRMRCLGTLVDTRQCYFEDVYYHVPTGRFHYFGPHGTGPKTYGHTPAPPSRAGRFQEDRWLVLGRCVRGGRRRQSADTQVLMHMHLHRLLHYSLVAVAAVLCMLLRCCCAASGVLCPAIVSSGSSACANSGSMCCEACAAACTLTRRAPRP
jgi:hypothetical protein